MHILTHNILTEEEKRALKQFKENIQDIVVKLEPYDALDANLVRWLRARDLDLNRAEEMIRKSMIWREEMGADEMRESPFSEFLLSKIPWHPTGFDLKGAAVTYLPIRKWRIRDLCEQGHQEDILKFYLQLVEFGTRTMRQMTTADHVYTQFVLIYDLHEMSYHQNFCKPILSLLTNFIKFYEANYPEKLRAAYVINVPKWFELFWSIIKPFMAENTLSKVHIYGRCPEKWRQALTSDVDPRELTSYLGGTNTTLPWIQNSNRITGWPPRAEAFPETEFVTEVVPNGGTFTKTFDLHRGQRISWNFKTDNYDIGFRFLKDDEPMFEPSRADAHLWVQDGLVDIVDDATYTLEFDNTYSRYRSKTLHYAIRIEPEQENPDGKENL